MKIGGSLFSKMRSFAGIEITHSGFLKRDTDGMPVLVRTVDINIGFVFGWITIGFPNGGQIRLDEINESLRQFAIKGQKIDTNE